MFLSYGLATLTATAVVCSLIYKFVIYPAFLSPLAKIPSAHPLATISSLWILSSRYHAQEVATIHNAHQRKGPVVRLGPNEISVNCVKGGLQTIYSGTFEKGIPDGNWYHFFTNYDGTTNMFSTARNKQHTLRKRMLSHVYSKSYLQSSRVMTAITTRLIKECFVPFLSRSAKLGPVDVCPIFSGIAMDMVTGYLFGLSASSSFTQNVKERDHFLKLYITRHDYGFWDSEWPEMARFLLKFGYDLTPDHVHDASEEIEKWTFEMCKGASNTLAKKGSTLESHAAQIEDYPVVYAQLRTAMQKGLKDNECSSHNSETQELQIASELLDQLSAGFDTSSITLTFLAQELSFSCNADAQVRLGAELRSLEVDHETGLPNSKALDNAAYLNAVLYETLRLHAAIPGPQPRTTPDQAGGTTLGPNGEYSGIPGGVRVSAQAWSLHRNPQVFPEPELWKPERWLAENDGKVEFRPQSEMNRWFWAFGSGGRMCIGSHLAIYQMKYVIYVIWANFRTAIVDDIGCIQKDAYTAPPRGHSLVIKLEQA